MLLDLQDLRADLLVRGEDGRERAGALLTGASLRIVKGRILGLLGEQGAGKSLIAGAMLGLVPPELHIVAGRALFEGQDLLRMGEGDLERLRGARIGYVVQDAAASLDPTMRVGALLLRAQALHRRVTKQEAAWRSETILSSLGVAEPRARVAAWPDHLSPGLRQRVMLALALVNDPQLLIADEPTAGLDLTVQAQILDLLQIELRRRRIGAMVLTRDPGVVAQYCDDVAVLHAGQVVEQGPVGSVFANPAHPYTALLLAATVERFRPGAARRYGGPAPDPFDLPTGCLFRDRCERAEERCTSEPPLVGSGVHAARCHLARLGAA